MHFKASSPWDSKPKGAKGQYATETAVLSDDKTRIIGYLEPDRVFRKYCSSTKHFLRKPPGICIDSGAFRSTVLPNAVIIQVHDIDSGRVYGCTSKLFNEQSFEIDRGFGPQLCLVLSRWEVSGENDRGDSPQPPALVGTQLSLDLMAVGK